MVLCSFALLLIAGMILMTKHYKMAIGPLGAIFILCFTSLVLLLVGFIGTGYVGTEVSLESNIEHWFNQPSKQIVIADDNKMVFYEHQASILYKLSLWPFVAPLYPDFYVLHINLDSITLSKKEKP